MKLYFYLLISLIGLSSCKCLVAYERGLKKFNQATQIENDRLYGVSDIPSAVITLDELYQKKGARPANRASETYYLAALAQLEKSLDCENKLQQRSILTTAYTLKALTEWQLRRYDAASATARTAVRQFNTASNPDPRDEALMNALDGLMIIDQLYDANDSLDQRLTDRQIDRLADDTTAQNAEFDALKVLYEQRFTNDRDTAKSLLRALEIIDRSCDRALGQDSTIQYLRNAQMAGLRTWQGNLDLLKKAGQRFRIFIRRPAMEAWFLEEQRLFDTFREQYFERLAALFPEGTNHPIYQFWINRI